MTIQLLDGSLLVEIKYEESDSGFKDNICLTIYESCPVDEKIMLAGETNIYLTPAEAHTLAACLLKAAEASRGAEKTSDQAINRSGGS
jgi:hypothetical protein